jgi:hypothetical protein
MKRILFIAMTGLLFASCTPDETTTPEPEPQESAIPADGWKFDGVKHTQVYVTRQESQRVVNALDATSGDPNTFGAFFHEYPTASGTYRIVVLVPDSSGARPGLNIADNEVIIVPTMAQSGQNNKTWWSTGAGNIDATVTVTNGKIKIEVPEIDVTDGTTTVKATGTILEN